MQAAITTMNLAHPSSSNYCVGNSLFGQRRVHPASFPGQSFMIKQISGGTG